MQRRAIIVFSPVSDPADPHGVGFLARIFVSCHRWTTGACQEKNVSLQDKATELFVQQPGCFFLPRHRNHTLHPTNNKRAESPACCGSLSFIKLDQEPHRVKGGRNQPQTDMCSGVISSRERQLDKVIMFSNSHRILRVYTSAPCAPPP